MAESLSNFIRRVTPGFSTAIEAVFVCEATASQDEIRFPLNRASTWFDRDFILAHHGPTGVTVSEGVLYTSHEDEQSGDNASTVVVAIVFPGKAGDVELVRRLRSLAPS